jgi:hypothetical protein
MVAASSSVLAAVIFGVAVKAVTHSSGSAKSTVVTSLMVLILIFVSRSELL